MSSLFSFSSGQKDHLILVVVAATTTIFIFRNNASEQYQKNIDIVPKAYFLGFSSYQIDNLILFAYFAHLIGKAMWAGSRRPTPKSMGQNDHLIFLRNNTEKSRWYCSEYSSAYCSEHSSFSTEKSFCYLLSIEVIRFIKVYNNLDFILLTLQIFVV